MEDCDFDQPWDFNQLFEHLQSLDLDQLQKVEVRCRELRYSIRSHDAIHTLRAEPICPRCGFSDSVKNGRSRGLQRHVCRVCRKTFSQASDTPISGLRNKGRLAEFAECMIQGLTIRGTAKKMGISTSTAFRWRHRFLEDAVHHQARARPGVIEADETYFRESGKGSRSLGRPARKRGGAAMGKKGSGKKAVVKKVAVLVMKTRGGSYVADRVLPDMTQKLAMPVAAQIAGKGATLFVDGSGAFRTVEKELGIKTVPVAVAYEGPVKMTPYGAAHVQSVNNYHERLKTWLNGDLRGVSTKHLPNYLAWMRMKEWFKDDAKAEDFIVTALGKQIINT